MRNFIYLFFILISIPFFAQKNTIDAKITYNDGRVENVKAGIITNMFDSKFVDPRSFTGKKIIIISNENKKEKIPTADIQRIDYTDLIGNERHFSKMPNYNGLVEIIYDGKAKWYKLYGSHLYDGSLTVQDYLYADNKTYFFSLLKNNRNKLKEFFANRPDLYPLIDNLNYNKLKNEDLLAILKKFDEK